MIKKIYLFIAVSVLAVSCCTSAKLSQSSESFATVTVIKKVAQEPDYSKIYPCPQLVLAPSYAQLGGFYAAYPDVEITPTLPPEGYEPFFITHYGRHGSRSQGSKSIYKDLIDPLEDALEENNLTQKGKDLAVKAREMYEQQKDSLGSLIPRGYAEHRHIIERMYAHYPQVFKDGSSVLAYSTQVSRVIKSMETAMATLSGLCPSLKITMDSSDQTQELYFDRPELNKARKRWNHIINDYSDAMDFSRLMASLFVDPSKVKASKYPEIASSLWILSAESLLTGRTDYGMYKYLTYEEACALWGHRCSGTGMALGPSVQEAKVVRADVVKALSHMIKSADDAISSDSAPRAVLHYAHDTQLVPLSHLMGIKGFTNSYDSPDKVTANWRDYLISPMGGNIQLVFFRKNASDDVLVKFMVLENEVALEGVKTDCWPFYHWKDAKSFLEKRCAEARQ